MIEVIKFQSIEYVIRNIDFVFGSRTIGIKKLNSVLMNENGGYVSDEARAIDENIFYFVEERHLFLNEKSLVSKIIAQL
ncbi:MAG: hypothetical protein PSN36_01570 [Gammaproteobacteria bacterium]|nr:hypothetical protein [Gammaproteobacteria bacterium]